MDDLDQAVTDLIDAVDAAGRDPDRTATAVRDFVRRQRSLGPGGSRRSFDLNDIGRGQPRPPRVGDDLPQLSGVERLRAIMERDPAEVADSLGRQVSDVAELQRAGDDVALLAAYLAPQKIDVRDTRYYREAYLPRLRAMDTSTTAEGKEFVPTELSGALVERIALQLLVANIFPSVDMPTNPFEIPGFSVSRVRGGAHTEQTADTGQTKIKKITPASRKITLTAAKFATEVILSKELEEDSLIPMLGFLRQEIADYLAADVEDTIINGDTTASHMDSDVTAADDPRKNWVGLRKTALAACKTDAANAALTSAMLRLNRKNMKKYGARADQLVHVISIASMLDLLADPLLQTVDKYGPQATILTGEIGKVDGVAVVISEYVRQDLNATGVFDNTTTNRTVAITVNKQGFLNGVRRAPRIQLLTELYAESDQDALIITNRRAFAPRFPAASEQIVALHYNVKT
jgi:HK97 family phage major capsid protein